MGTRQAIYQRISTAAWDAQRWVVAYQQLSQYDTEAVYPLLRGYIRDKLLLSPEDGEADALLDLADISLRKTLRLKKEGKLLGDISRGCSGASSVIGKKVLLIKAIQTDFDVTISPQQSADLTTITELCRFIVSQKQERS